MKRGNKKYIWLIPIGLILIFVIIIIIVICSLGGKTTITGEFYGDEKLETLVCESERTDYPIFNFDSSNSKFLKINAFFNDNELISMSLYYRLSYPNEEFARKSESINHAAMNLSFYDVGMRTDDLGAKYSFIDNDFQMSIYAKKSDFNEESLRYFMLYNISEVKNLTKEKMAEIYNKAGLDCKIKYNNKEEVNEE